MTLEQKYIDRAKDIIHKWGYEWREKEIMWGPIAEALQKAVYEERARILSEVEGETGNHPGNGHCSCLYFHLKYIIGMTSDGIKDPIK